LLSRKTKREKVVYSSISACSAEGMWWLNTVSGKGDYRQGLFSFYAGNTALRDLHEGSLQPNFPVAG
jgi:hypothetical protein